MDIGAAASLPHGSKPALSSLQHCRQNKGPFSTVALVPEREEREAVSHDPSHPFCSWFCCIGCRILEIPPTASVAWLLPLLCVGNNIGSICAQRGVLVPQAI